MLKLGQDLLLVLYEGGKGGKEGGKRRGKIKGKENTTIGNI